MYIVDTCEIVELPTRPILNNNAVVTANARALAFACSCSQFIRCYLCDAAAAAAIIIWECGVAVRAHHRHSYYAIQQEQEHLIDGYNTHLLYVPYILFALCWMCIYGLSVFQIASQSVSRMPMPDSILNGVYASVVDDEQMCAAAAVTAGEFPFSSCVCCCGATCKNWFISYANEADADVLPREIEKLLYDSRLPAFKWNLVVFRLWWTDPLAEKLL